MLITDETLLQYKRCKRKAFLNFHCQRDEKPRVKDFVKKLKQERIIHTKQVIEHYNWRVYHGSSSGEESTLDLMRRGVDCG